MAVCRYFMEGYCRYGQRCKFKHPYNNSRDTDYYGYEEQNNYKPSHQNAKGYSGVSILRGGNAQQSTNNESSFSNSNYNAGTGFSRPNYSTPSNFGGVNYNTSSGNNQRTNVSNQNVHDIVAATLKEIETIENGHQWPLTCFCPLREASNVPGWVDHSPEELRWEIYKASKDGTFEQCKASIQQLFKEAQDRRNDFKSRDKAVNIVENMLQKKKSSSTTTGATAPSFFQQNNTTASQNATTSGFFQQNNTSAIQNTTTSSFFPQNNTPAGHNDVYNPAPMFGSASQPFGSNFANPQTPVAASQPAVFHDPAPAFSFSLNQNSTNSFNTNTPSSVFQSVPNQPSSNQDVFNRMPKASVSDYNGNTVYSNLSELDKSELASFQANVFDFGQVPLKPPPKELC